MSTQHETLALAGQWANDFDQNQIVLFSEHEWLPNTPSAMGNHLDLEISSTRPSLPDWNESLDYVPIADRLDECEELLNGAANPLTGRPRNPQALRYEYPRSLRGMVPLVPEAFSEIGQGGRQEEHFHPYSGRFARARRQNVANPLRATSLVQRMDTSARARSSVAAEGLCVPANRVVLV